MSLGVSQSLLDNLGLDLKIGQFVSQALVIDPETFALLVTCPYLLLQQHSALNGHIVLGFQVLQGRCGIPGLSLIVVVCNLNVT
jgi:hypothetical protein